MNSVLKLINKRKVRSTEIVINNSKIKYYNKEMSEV